ncbi:MAG: hypothetical protein ACKOX6_15290 [Bdellovibrio sp.]
MGNIGTSIQLMGRIALACVSALLISGCTMDSLIEALTQENYKLLTNIEDHHVHLNSSTLALEGQCDKSKGPINFKVNSIARNNINCPASGTWQHALDVQDLGEGEALVVVEQFNLDATKPVKTETITLNKDTIPPQLLNMPDIILNDKDFISWDCQNLNDQCSFRSFVASNDLFTFTAEPFTSLKSNMTFPTGKSYLFLQARDAAGNISAVKKVEVYSGTMGIWINPLSMKLAFDQNVNLRFYIPQAFNEYTLFNNETCTGTENWQNRNSGDHAWTLSSSTGGAYFVSAKFRAPGSLTSQCFTDRILIFSPSALYNICASGASSAPFGIVTSSAYGQSPGYANNENCNFTVNSSEEMDVLIADGVNTETAKDIASIRQNSQTIYSTSGIVSGGLSPVVSTAAGPFTFNFISDGQNTSAGFSFYWFPKKTIRSVIAVNGGAVSTSSKNLRITFDVPPLFKEYYLADGATCTAGGTWKPLSTGEIAHTSNVDASANTIEVSARFRDTFGNESECVNTALSYSPPLITILTPGAASQIENSLSLSGACSQPGGTVKISGSYSAEVSCASNGTWSKSFSLTGIANNSTINITADLMIDGNKETSAQRSWTIARDITPVYPATTTGYVGPTFTMQGTCTPNGATINITSPTPNTVTCTANEWSSAHAVTGNDGDTVTLAGNLVYEGVTQDSFSYPVTLSTQAPTAVIAGTPVGKTAMDTLSMNVSGIGVTIYKYKYGKGISCSTASGYSAEQSADQGLFVNHSSYTVGDTITLCVLGKSSLNGLWQDFSVATTASWQYTSLKLVSLTGSSYVANEGNSGIKLTVQLGAISSSPVKVYYQIAGDAIYMLDHNLYPGFIEVPAGSVAAEVTFDTLNNPAVKDSTLEVYLTHTDQADYYVGENYAKHYIIRDPVRSTQKVIGFVNGSDTNPSMTCALTEDGRLRCWGQGSNAPTGINEPQPTMRFKQITGNRVQFCAISDQDDLYCASYGNFTNTNYDPGVKYKSIQLKTYMACGITSDDRVRCWRTDTGSGYTTKYIDDGVVKFKKVAPSHGTICAISLDDDLYCAGENTYKTIANNSTTTYSTLTLVDSGTKYLDVTAYTYVCGITLTTQQMRCWGRNDYNQLGNGNSTNNPTPTVIDSGTKYTQVSGSNTKVCAITDSSQLKCWGKQVSGGYNSIQTTKAYTTPLALNTNLEWKSVIANEGTVCGISNDDLPYCFGDDQNYRTAAKGLLPQLELVDSSNQYADYTVGQGSFCAIRNDGSAVCSGPYNASTGRRYPRAINPLVNFTGGHLPLSTEQASCVSTPTATYCARYNYFGHLADGTNNNDRPDYSLVGGAVLAAVSGNTYCAVGIDTQGNLKSWNNMAMGGYSCQSTVTPYPKNILPSVLFKPVIGSEGTDSHCALSQAGEIYCWGSGILLRGSPSSSTPASVDPDNIYEDFKMAGNRLCGILKASGQLRCWGDGTNGKLGNNSTGASTGTSVQGNYSYSKLAMSTDITCALRGTTLDCWGGSATHNSLVPFTLNSGAAYKDFAVNSSEVIAITSGGDVHIWDNGQFKNAPRMITPAGKTFKSVKSSAVNSMFCALSTEDKLYCRNINGPMEVKHFLRQVKEARF